MMVSPEIVVGVRMGDLFEVVRDALMTNKRLSCRKFTSDYRRQSFLCEAKQGERVMHASVLHGQRQRIDIAGHGVNHGHHETWRTNPTAQRSYFPQSLDPSVPRIPQYAQPFSTPREFVCDTFVAPPL